VANVQYFDDISRVQVKNSVRIALHRLYANIGVIGFCDPSGCWPMAPIAA
jgi:hypothetical protein